MPPVGLSGFASGRITSCPGVSRASRAASPIVRPVTVISSGCSRPASRSRRAITAIPPAWYMSGAAKRPAGFRSARTGTFRETRSKSSIDSRTPASFATARRCSTTLVEPPVAIAPAIPFRKAFRVMICRGVTPCRRSSITSFPVSNATSSFRESIAGTSL